MFTVANPTKFVYNIIAINIVIVEKTDILTCHRQLLIISYKKSNKNWLNYHFIYQYIYHHMNRIVVFNNLNRFYFSVLNSYSTLRNFIKK